MNKIVLLFGHSGLLGKKVYSYLKTDKDIKVVTIGRSSSSDLIINFDNQSEILKALNQIKPNCIIQSAANIDVLEGESELLENYKINFFLNIPVIEYCKKTGSQLIFISSDYVFQDSNLPVQEESLTSPLNNYGLAKYFSESSIRLNLSNYHILRPAILYGFNELKDTKNFVTKIIESNSIGLDNIRLKYPVLIDDVADLIVKMMKGKYRYGIYHASSKRPMTKFQMGKIIQEVFELKNDLFIKNEPNQNIKPNQVILGDSNDLNLLEFREGINLIKKQMEMQK